MFNLIESEAMPTGNVSKTENKSCSDNGGRSTAWLLKKVKKVKVKLKFPLLVPCAFLFLFFIFGSRCAFI